MTTALVGIGNIGGTPARHLGALHRNFLDPSHGALNASSHDGIKRRNPRFNGRRRDISCSPGNAPGPSLSAS
jgi:hypothetical protein